VSVLWVRSQYIGNIKDRCVRDISVFASEFLVLGPFKKNTDSFEKKQTRPQEAKSKAALLQKSPNPLDPKTMKNEGFTPPIYGL